MNLTASTGTVCFLCLIHLDLPELQVIQVKI
jgi:hypothetical protein